MICTFFEALNIPVFWPILVMYFIILFTITMKRQIKVGLCGWVFVCMQLHGRMGGCMGVGLWVCVRVTLDPMKLEWADYAAV